jgi:hypothetical protein
MSIPELDKITITPPSTVLLTLFALATFFFFGTGPAFAFLGPRQNIEQQNFSKAGEMQTEAVPVYGGSILDKAGSVSV